MTNVVLLRVRAETPHQHVLLHALAKRRNGCIGRRGCSAARTATGQSPSEKWAEKQTNLVCTWSRHRIGEEPLAALVSSGSIYPCGFNGENGAPSQAMMRDMSTP